MPWETEDGMPTDSEMEVSDAQFIIDEKYINNMGQPQPVLALYYKNSNGQERRQYLSIGSGWEIVDGGARVESQVRNAIHASSNLGRWIDCIAEIAPQDVLDELGEPTEADTWVGLKLHIEEESYEIEGEKKVRLVPTEFLGIAGGSSQSKPEPEPEAEAADENPFGAGETSGSTERMEQPDPETEKADGELTRRDNMQLGRWAGECETFDEFDEKIFQNANKLSDAGQDALMDGDFAREIWERLS